MGGRIDFVALRRRAKVAVASLTRPIFAMQARRIGETDLADWNLSRNDDGRLMLGSVDVGHLAREHGTPLHVIDRERLAAQLGASSFTTDGFTMAAAHRCTHVTGVVEEVLAAGWRVTTSSPYELDAAIAAGVDPAQVVHAPSVMSDVEFVAALSMRVGIICLPDLGMLAAAASHLRKSTASDSLLGVSVDIDGGVDLVALAEQVRDLEAADRSVCRHLHVRSTTRSIGHDDLDGVADAAATSWIAMADVLSLDTLSISIDLRPPTVRPISGIDAQLNRALGRPIAGRRERAEPLSGSMERLLTRLRSAGVDAAHVIVDAGTGATGGTQLTLVSVISIDAGTDVTHVVLDCGINVAEHTLAELHELIPTSEQSIDQRGPKRPHRLVGPICTPADVLYANWWMTPPAAGDVLAIMDTGGPSVAESTTFSFPRPAIVSVTRDGDTRLLRDAESFEDLVALDVFEPMSPTDASTAPPNV